MVYFLLANDCCVDATKRSYAFDANGKKYADEVRRFFEAIGIKVATGEYFEPGSVPDKVRGQIERSDMFVAIITP